jgi:DNA polymerase III subunit delta
MRIDTDLVPRTLERGLAPAWLIAGDEALLTGEAADLVRARARKEGFTGRDLFTTDRSFDWSEVTMASRTLSLFSERRILEIRMPSARPGKEGGAALAALAADPGPDNLVLVITTRPEREAWSSAWLKAFEKHGVFALSSPVEIDRLPQWISQRASKLGLTLDRGAAEFLAERVEGNLLAAQQEIERIALLNPGSTLDADAVAGLVADNARYDVFELSTAAFLGNAARALRILDGLRSEGREPPLILWALLNDLRAVSRVLQREPNDRNIDGIFRTEQVWGSRQGPIKVALKRLHRADIDSLLTAAARADRVAKGSLRGEPWVEITGLVARIAGVKLAAA